ncbi:substrate-binding periplasmic protein [Spartinivicinus ruber]|uniref:substrate-binding periplasmic protein n=1 Tax=Spartinivicinus ruber TaxID=2683272 RepID=UPI0013D34325|nr:transporter substrate-binding domain-containing protein [Spartinivicinus ruber]
MKSFKSLSILSIFIAFHVCVHAGVLKVDVRHRPPEMVITQDTKEGPLIDILNALAAKTDNTVKLSERQFRASYMQLVKGNIDLLPRTICTPSRAKEIDFLGPIGYQDKFVRFFVKSNDVTINEFSDLARYKIGVKKGTFYFDEFNNEINIRKIESSDDTSLIKMLEKDRFDAMAVLDSKSVEETLKKENIDSSQFRFAKYQKEINIGNYFGMKKNHPLKASLQKTVEEMVLSGEVAKAYKQYNLQPPKFNTDIGFIPCSF